MKLTWYTAYLATYKGLDREHPIVILSDRPHEEATALDPAQFIGFIERDRSGSWLCYTFLRDQRRFVGFEPNKHYAKVRVLNAIKEEIQLRLVLVAE
jgi:hypothetical protein